VARLLTFVRQVRSLSGSEAYALIEALVLVTLAAPAVRLVPFRRLGRLAATPVKRALAAEGERARIVHTVAWAVDVASRVSRLRALCFECGLAAQIMLRRRGVPSTLYFGAAPNHQKGLGAHVWVMAGDIDVTGGDVASSFAPLAAFTSQPGSADAA